MFNEVQLDSTYYEPLFSFCWIILFWNWTIFWKG